MIPDASFQIQSFRMKSIFCQLCDSQSEQKRRLLMHGNTRHGQHFFSRLEIKSFSNKEQDFIIHEWLTLSFRILLNLNLSDAPVYSWFSTILCFNCSTKLLSIFLSIFQEVRKIFKCSMKKLVTPLWHLLMEMYWRRIYSWKWIKNSRKSVKKLLTKPNSPKRKGIAMNYLILLTVWNLL